MLAVLKRWMAYLLLPAALVLLFVPMSTNRLGQGGKAVLFLDILEVLAVPEHPDVSDPPLPEPKTQEDAWRQLKRQQEQMALAQARADAVMNPYGYPRIRAEDLARYPALKLEVAAMRRMYANGRPNSHRPIPQDAVPPQEWDAFRKAFGIKDGSFQFGRHVFKGWVETVPTIVPMEVKHLRTGGRIVGGLFLVLGLLFLKGCYARTSSGGIYIGKRSAILIWDVIIVLVQVVFALWLLDTIFAKVFHTAPEWDETMIRGMGFFMMVLANPVLAFITTAMSLQILMITGETIGLKGVFGLTTVDWSAVEGFRVSQVFSPRRLGGMWAPKRVMKMLKIDAGTTALHVMEPPYKSTKKEIIAALMEHAPEKLKTSITIASKEWLSYL